VEGEGAADIAQMAGEIKALSLTTPASPVPIPSGLARILHHKRERRSWGGIDV